MPMPMLTLHHLVQTSGGLENGLEMRLGPNRISVLTPSPDFPTIDPAPSSAPQSIPELRTALLNTSLPLFERYRAMFALRDFGAGSKDAVLALAAGFKDASALFR
jgi:deoxyhypusine monooxygenase